MTTLRRGHYLTPAALIIGAVLSLPAAGQRESYSYVSYAGADVALLSSASDEETARINTPVLSGDRLVTGAGSRAEVVLASGNLVRADLKTELRFDRMVRTYESDDDRDLLFLLRGAVAAEIRSAESGERAFRLDTDDATVVVEGRGHVRVDAGRRGTEVYVLSGEAAVVGRGGQEVLRAGQYAFVLGSNEIDVQNLDPPRDRFTRFVDERSDRRPQGGAATWVASDYEYESSLAGFDDNGSWVYASSSDRWCWRPAVSPDWRPYTYGTWRWTPCGLTWVSYEPWGWLPYHYGSWFWESAYGWVWMPGSAYAPAWVYWSYSPSYVGWCPIGYYGNHWDRSTGSPRFPHFRGLADLTRIDPRGWNYAPATRLGGRLDPSRDIVRGEHVPLRPGETGIISTSPLRIEKGAAPASAAVREAVRKISQSPASRNPLPVNEGLTALLRRDANLTPAAEQELRRSLAPLRARESLRPVSPDALLRPRGGEAASVRGDDWRTTGARSRATSRTEVSSTRKPDPVRENGWRSPASTAPRDLSPRPTEVPGQNDTGWRAPRAADGLRARETPVRRGADGDWREAPARAPLSRSAPAPAPHAAAPAPARRESDPGPAPAPAPHAPAAPRNDSPRPH
ncbi:MAG TPA: FecR family protein [Thermoanaerobaculia bacterium]|nr:FecR family protein [Thermoanaerobaculia bacterium]